MPDFAPSTQQVAIIETDAPRFVVRAAAGSGKTFVLVQRYLRHVLEEGCDPRSVLAFTFTTKAAAEMRKRVVDELRKRDRPELAQAVETGPISTIHGFCERLLRENALEAGIDPEFEITSDADAADMLRTAVRDVLTSSEGALSDDAIDLIGELTGRMEYGTTGPYDYLEHAVLQLLEAFRGAGLSPADLQTDLGDAAQLLRRWHALMLAALPAEVGIAVAATVGGCEFYPSLHAAINQLGLQGPAWLKDSATSVESAAAGHAVGLAELARDAWQRLESRMFELRRLDFTALERRAVRLLEQSQATLDRVKATYRHVLVDEAQDLNPTQHKLIDSMTPVSLMLVGDGQQSIYGFRQADLDMFERKAAELPRWDLSVNHRSTDPILRFVDTVAGSLWPDNYQPMMPERPFDLDVPSRPAEADFEGVELWLSGRHSATLDSARWIEEMVKVEGESAGRIGVLVRSWGYGAALVAELLRRGVAARLSGGLSRFYTRLEVRDLANLLRAVANPSDNFSLLSVLHSPLAGLSFDSIAMLALEDRAYDALEQFGPPVAEDALKLRKFLSWFGELSKRGGRLSAWETLSEVFASSAYLEALASRPRSAETLANVRKLIVLATERPELGPAEFAERMGDVESLRHREAEATTVDDHAEAVTVLTMHSAKGLEFDIVVLPDTHSAVGNRVQPVEVDPRLAAFSAKFDGDPSPFHAFLAKRRQDREREDASRLLYVALTRSRRRLAVVTDPQARNNTFAGMVAHAVGLSARGRPLGYRIRETGTRVAADATGNLD